MPEKARRYIAGLPHSAGKPLRSIYPNASDEALELLGGMLCWDPSQRCTVAQALSHPYLAAFHNPEAEPVATTPFDFNGDNTAVDAHDALFNEVCRFRPELERHRLPRHEQKAKRSRQPSCDGMCANGAVASGRPAGGPGANLGAASSQQLATAAAQQQQQQQQQQQHRPRYGEQRSNAVAGGTNRAVAPGGRAEWDSPLKCELARVGEREVVREKATAVDRERRA